MSSTPTVTIDHCCLIALEKREPGACHVEALIAASRCKRIDLAVGTIGAIENTTAHLSAEVYEHERRLKNLGLEDVGKVPHVAHFGLAHWGNSVWGGDKNKDLEKRIWKILFPNFQSEPPQNMNENGKRSKQYKTWVNHFCDVNLVLAHALTRREVLVTTDGNLIKKQVALQGVGVGKVMKPYELLQMLDGS